MKLGLINWTAGLIFVCLACEQSVARKMKKSDCTVGSAKQLLTDEFWDSKERVKEFTKELYRTKRKLHEDNTGKKSDFDALLYVLQSCEFAKFAAATAQFAELTINQQDDSKIPKSHLVQAANAAIDASAECTMYIHNLMEKGRIDELTREKVNKIVEWTLMFREAVDKNGCLRSKVSESLASVGA